MTDQERFIPVLEALTKKVCNLEGLTQEDKTFLSAIISNQIHVQSKSTDIVTYDDVEIYEFVKEITYQKDIALQEKKQ